MIMNMIASGTLRRYPRARIIVAHGGGTLPFLATCERHSLFADLGFIGFQA
jgi:predicted TIM-barrel fold metal-dependent hydrolase